MGLVAKVRILMGSDFFSSLRRDLPIACYLHIGALSAAKDAENFT